MFSRLTNVIRPLFVLALMLASLTPAAVGEIAAQSDRGLIDETAYQSPQFGYSIEWGDPWTVRERDVITNPGGFDTITLRSLDGVLRVSGRADTYDPLTFLQDTVAIQLASGGEVINLDTTAAVPSAELQIGLDRMRLDVITLPEFGAVVLLSLRADERDYASVLQAATSTIEVAGNPVFGTPPETTTSSTAEADATQPSSTEGPLVQTPAPESTTVPMGGGVEGTSYTSPNFGFSVDWDPSVWTVPDDGVYAEPDYDYLMLDSEYGLLWVTGWRSYNGMAATCLLGEVTYYNDPEIGVSNWQVAVDAEGNELAGEEEGRAWGVYTSTYSDPEDPNAPTFDYVDYIECVSLNDGESVAIIYTYTLREDYNAHIENVLALSDSLALPQSESTPAAAATFEAPQTTETPATSETPEPSPTQLPEEIPTQGTPSAQEGSGTDVSAGDTVTGTTYSYNFTVPVGWQASESALGGDVERTVLTNGTSTVAVEARTMSTLTLSDCVSEAAAQHETQPEYGDLVLARTASGDAFAGEDDFAAFANFTFTGPEDETWSHFIECRWIVEGESALLVIQDVPQELFGSERAGRRQIQNSIEVGP